MADGAAEIEEGGIVRTLKDLFAGAAGGVAQVLLGMRIISSSPACRRY
jgi:solute carrier family 25 (mitochondrial carnitine/acylcarnitine transporter), member 20/29